MAGGNPSRPFGLRTKKSGGGVERVTTGLAMPCALSLALCFSHSTRVRRNVQAGLVKLINKHVEDDMRQDIFFRPALSSVFGHLNLNVAIHE